MEENFFSFSEKIKSADKIQKNNNIKKYINTSLKGKKGWMDEYRGKIITIKWTTPPNHSNLMTAEWMVVSWE